MSKTYTTVQGDMWDSIAYRELGSTDYTADLMRKNIAYHDLYIFPAGIELVLPDVPQKGSEQLPPWKKVEA